MLIPYNWESPIHIGAVLLNFSDRAIPEKATAEYVKGAIMSNPGNVNDYYKEVSFNKLELQTDVYGPFPTEFSYSGNCNYLDFRNAALEKIAPQSLSSFDRFIVILPFNPQCEWQAITDSTTIYLNGLIEGNTDEFNFRAVMVHELGHSFGLNHAGIKLCYNSPTDPKKKVSISDYCINNNLPQNAPLHFADHYDPMGSGGLVYFNGYHTYQLGVLSSSNIITAYRGWTTYTLTPLEIPGTGLKVLRIPRTENQYYYIDYRTAVSLDTDLITFTIPGVHIRLAPADRELGNLIPGTELIDATITAGQADDDFYDATLHVGQTFYDALRNMEIKLISATSEGAQVRINSMTIPCIRQNPTITMLDKIQKGTTGSIQLYRLTVTNNDTPSCPSSIFTISSYTRPLNWSDISFSSAETVNLRPGQTSPVITAYVKSPINEKDGKYYFTIKAANKTLVNSVKTQLGTYIITKTATPTPTLTPTSPPTPTPTTTPSGSTPFIIISTPIDKQIITGSLSVVAEAMPSYASNTKNFVIYIDDVAVKYCTYATNSCSFWWNNPSPGQHKIYATAQDKANPPNDTISEIITITKN